MQRVAQAKGAMGGGAPLSFANSGGASPPGGTSGGAGAGLGAQNMTGAGVGVGGGGPASFSIPGSSTAGQNIGVGAVPNSNFASLGAEGSSNAGQSANPANVNTAVSTLTDLTSGVGPPLGTSYGTPTQGNVGNPAGPIGAGANAENGAFEVGGGMSPPTTTSGLGPGSASMGQNIANLIQPGDKSNMGRTIPKQIVQRRPASNSLNLNSIFPQTGQEPYRGVLG